MGFWDKEEREHTAPSPSSAADVVVRRLIESGELGIRWIATAGEPPPRELRGNPRAKIKRTVGRKSV
jgi:hypothetical protein